MKREGFRLLYRYFIVCYLDHLKHGEEMCELCQQTLSYYAEYYPMTHAVVMAKQEKYQCTNEPALTE